MATIKKTITGLKPATNYLFSLKPKNTEISAIDAIPDTIRVQTPSVVSTPSSITGLLLAANFKSAMLRFNHASMVDLDYYEYKIYLANDVTETALKARASTVDGAMVSGITKSNLVVISDLDNTTLTGASPTPVEYRAKVRAVNTAGNAGAFSSASESAATQLIQSQFIENLVASKIQAGTIGAHEIILTQPSAAQTSYTPPGSTAVLRSSNYLPGSGGAGWLIRGDGFAEFDATNIRGSLAASSISLNDHNYWLPNSANPIFKVGSSTKYFQWDGADLTTTGNLITNATVTGGTVGGITVGSGVTVNRFYIGTGEFNNANTAFFVNSAGQFSLKDKFVWTGNALTIAGDVTIGSQSATAVSTAVTTANNAATAAANAQSTADSKINGAAVNANVTSISGGVITTGTINLNNGVNIQTSGNTARINITSAGFFAYNAAGTNTVAINADGSATFTGAISGGTVTGSTIQNAASSPTFKVDTSGNVFANNMYATGSTGGNDGGIQIRADGGTSGATNGNVFIYHGRPSSGTTYSIRLGGPTAVDPITGGPINYKFFSVNQLTGQTSGPANVTRIQSSENAIQIDASNVGIGGRPASNRTLMVHGDIILGEGADNYDLLSKNFSSAVTAGRVAAFVSNSSSSTGYRYLGDGTSLRELKENIEDISVQEAYGTIVGLRPRKFTWKPTIHDTEYSGALKKLDIDYGFIAEEVEESARHLSIYKLSEEAVEEWPNLTDAGINTSKLHYYKESTLTPLLMTVVKNLIERVEFLEAQLAAQ